MIADPYTVHPDHVHGWLDRMGNMVFLSDEHDGDTVNPAFARLMWEVSDRSHGRIESATLMGA